MLEQVLRDVLVNDQLAGVDDAHVHAGLDRVKQKRRVDGFADDVIAAERKRQVADPAADLHAWARRLDDARGLDEVDGVVVVLFEPGGDGEDVGIEDDVGRIEAGLFGQNLVRALTDRDLALDGIRLSDLVEGHDYDAGAKALNDLRLVEKVGLAFLEADRVDDALALGALEPGLEHRPLRAVDHHRDTGNLRLGRDVVEERRHGLLGIEHALVHVDVDEVGAVADLLGRDLHGRRVVVVLDEAGELRRPGDIGALTDHLKVAVGPDGQRFEAGELGKVLAALGFIGRLTSLR